jgi:hypothetical protein
MQRADCVLWFHETKSATAVQRRFRRMFGLIPPARPSIYTGYKQFIQSGRLCNDKSSGRPPVSEATVNRVRQTFVCSPRKSTRRASRELAISQSTVRKTVRKRLQLKCYQFQILKKIKPDDIVKRTTYCAEMMENIAVEDNFLSSVVLSDKATFRLSETVHRHRCGYRAWRNRMKR